MTINIRRKFQRSVFVAIIGMAGATAAFAEAPDRIDPLPYQFDDVKVVEHPNAALPLDTQFKNENGAAVKLGDYFDGKKPVILVPVYFQCPMLCTQTLNEVVNAAKEMTWSPGAEYQIVTYSIDPHEGPDLAKRKKLAYMASLNRPGAENGFHFLTSDEASIERLSEAIGFFYRYDPKTKQFAHKAAILMITPDGRISRYILDLNFDTSTIRLSLFEAADGKIGSTISRVVNSAVLTCFSYDPKSGSYAAEALGFMKLGGLTVFLILAASLGGLEIAAVRRRKRQGVMPDRDPGTHGNHEAPRSPGKF